MSVVENQPRETQNRRNSRVMAPASDNDNYVDKDVCFSQRLSEETTAKKLRLTHSRHQTLTPPSLPSSHQHMPNRDQVHAPLQGSLPVPTLPFELIVEILSRLPVKFLLQLRCVCKSWKSLISDPQFVKKHLCRSTMDPDFTHHRMIFGFSRPNFTLKSCSVSSIFNGLPTGADILKYPLKARARYHELVGSCDGLLCFAIDQRRVILWNPSTRAFKKLPYLENERQLRCYTVFGFGYDSIIHAYKVVAFLCFSSASTYRTEVNIYTLGDNSWRKIPEFPLGVQFAESGKFVSGTLNWLASASPGSCSSYVIISLDLGKESYLKILQPDYKKVLYTLSLGVLRNCLCILYNYEGHSDLWLMKDYGVKESWTRLFTIAYSDPEYPLYFPSVKPHCISEIGEVLLEFNSKVFLYNWRNTTLTYPDIEDVNGWIDAEVYVESLISPCC